MGVTRRALLGGAGGAGLLGVAGCGALTPAGTGPSSLRVHTSLGGTSPGADVFADLTKVFRSEHPDIDLAVVTSGSDLPIVYETSRLAGAEADVVMVNLVGNQLSWTGLDATVPVQTQLADWGLADRVLPPALAEWTTADGDLRAFPYFASNWPVAWNTGLLGEFSLSVPRTAEELVEVAQVLRAHGIAPVTTGGSDWSGQKLFCQIIQAYVDLDEATEFFTTGDVGAHPDVVRGIAHFVDLRDAGVFVDQAQGLTSDSQTTQYNARKAAGQMAMTSALASTPTAVAAESVVGGWPVPADSVHEHPTSMRGYSVMGIWVSPNGEEKLDMVREFVEFMYRDDVAGRFVSGSGRDLCLQSSVVPDDFPLVAAAARLGSDDVSLVLLPDLSVPTAASEPLIQASGRAFAPGSTVDDVVAALTTAYASV